MSVADFSPSRRRFVTGATATGLLAGLNLAPSVAFARQVHKQPQALRGKEFNLTISHLAVNFTGAERFATAVNGSVPGPT